MESTLSLQNSGSLSTKKTSAKLERNISVNALKASINSDEIATQPILVEPSEDEEKIVNLDDAKKAITQDDVHFLGLQNK